MALSGTFYGTTANSLIVPKIVWGATQSYADNASTVTAILYYSRENSSGDVTTGYWQGSLTINGNTKTVESNKITISYQSNTAAMSHTVVVPHMADGTCTITISATGRIGSTSLSSTTISSTITLDPFNRISTLTAGNGTLGKAQTLTIAKANSSFTHTIKYSCGSASGTICTKTSGTSVSWTPPLSLASQNTTGTSLLVELTMTTYAGNEPTGNAYKSITLTIPDSVVPSCSLSISDAEGHLATYGGYVMGVSKFAVTVTPTLAYGSEITAYKTTANGSTYTTSSFTTGAIKSSGTLEVTATVTDKRGRNGSKTSSLTVLPYSFPRVSKLTVSRCLEDGTDHGQGEYAKVTFSTSITDVSNKNTASYALKRKKTTESEYETIQLTDYQGQLTVTNGVYIFKADSDSVYDVILIATDNFSSVSKTTSASSAYTMMHWPATGMGMAVGKIAELVNTFDVGFRTRHLGGVLHPILTAATNLDDVVIPNTYASLNASDAGYLNSPVASGLFLLEVSASGENEDAIIQRLTVLSKTNPVTYKRVFENASWGEWVDELTVFSETLASLQGKVYADGYVTVTVSSLPTKGIENYDIPLPSGVSEYWLDTAWIVVDGERHQLPYCHVDYGVQMTASITSSQKLKVNGWLSEGYNLTHSGHFVIGYKL